MSQRLRRIVPAALVAMVLGLLAPGVDTTARATARVAQDGVTTLSAPVVQPGRRPTASDRARLTGTVAFRPVRQGRRVVVQRRLGDAGDWRRVAVRRQDRSGRVHFTGPAYSRGGTPYAYRGVARRHQGLPAHASSPRAADVWAPEFTDEFNRRRLGDHWRDRVSRATSRTCARVGDPRMSRLKGGTLRLSVKLDPARRNRTCRSDGERLRYYLNGQVSTQHIPHAFTRGTFAARIKFARKRGQHGGFWLQPLRRRNLAGRPARSGAEIDVVEFFGQGYPEGGLASFLYNYGIQRGTKKIGGVWPQATRMLPRGDTWWKRYHVFSMEWTKRSYAFSVDGRQHWRTRRGVSGIDEYLILSMLTSDWELAQAKRKGIRPGGTMNVDWVRVWQK